MRVRFSARTHVGMRREVNQDAYDGRQLGQATLLVVCDGMGGHAAGEVASQLGVETIIASFSDAAPPDDALRHAFVAANERIYSEGHGSMGTTGVAALFLRNSLHVANVGDSRAYLVREGQIRQISHDHSFVSDQVAAGLMTPEQARASHVRNIITRALGHSPEVEVDLFAVELLAGDTVVLSSDGMHGLVADDEIAEVAGMLPPDEAVQRLVDLSNERGGTDNITVVIAQVDELDAAGEDPGATRVLRADPSGAITEPLPAPPPPPPA
ncbi:MAG TPA: protein phosphatase 2C domain-containing protein, partial [Chloroflexaceae bacterium]|nr:protein phosphatase 2C domain-containing protein [Chloroflexaceae bacterium]